MEKHRSQKERQFPFLKFASIKFTRQSGLVPIMKIVSLTEAFPHLGREKEQMTIMYACFKYRIMMLRLKLGNINLENVF